VAGVLRRVDDLKRRQKPFRLDLEIIDIGIETLKSITVGNEELTALDPNC
jgi:hypothetical protein